MLGAQRLKMQLDIKKEGFLWLSGKDYTNWKAFFNGREVKMHDGPNATLKSVYLPQGNGELLLKYRSISTKRLILFIGLVLCLVVAYFVALYSNFLHFAKYLV